MVLSPQGAVFL
ncbi:hypothetical protein YW7DRAFT_03222 [Streptomyces sp. AmelKG-E11A]|nr:hypothetical protein YW7DRAFT_03222 [Streptomyces sp. AmelKG-E11A]